MSYFDRLKEDVACGKAVVLVNEEYDYRHWLWLSGLTASELTEWWDNKPITGLCDPSKSFGGEWIGITEWWFDTALEICGSDVWAAHFHEDDDSWLKVNDVKPSRRRPND